MLLHTGGCFYMFNRRTTRFFRKDGHDWKKKGDGKTVKETHEKLKASAPGHTRSALSMQGLMRALRADH